MMCEMFFTTTNFQDQKENKIQRSKNTLFNVYIKESQTILSPKVWVISLIMQIKPYRVT